ncbi:MAG: ribonuclease H-like domain-containing protein [Candidatus Helarchaeota archaeon]
MTTEIILDIETTGLDCFKDRVIAIGCRKENETFIFMKLDEEQMLSEFWTWLNKQENWKLIGYNIISFDLHFLIHRSLKYGIKMINKRILLDKTVDIMTELNFFNKFRKLQDYAKLLGINGKYNNYDGSKIPVLFEYYEYDEIRRYLEQDLEMTYYLWQKIKGSKIFS